MITTITPVYKDLADLKETLTSLRNQSLQVEKFEILVANDGGDSEITAFCEKEGIKVIDIKPNQGSYHARNEAVKLATTPYIAFIDAGTIAERNWLENGLKYLSAYDYVAGDVKMMPDKVVDIATFHDYLTAFPIKSYFETTGFGVTANLFIRKKLLDKLGCFDARLRSGGDMEFGVRVAAHASFKRFFAADCICYHAPRNHREKITKIKRVAIGHKMLRKLHGDLFPFLKKRRGLFRTLKGLLPGRWSAVSTIYQPDKRFSKLQLYIYMYKIKLIKIIYHHYVTCFRI